MWQSFWPPQEICFIAKRHCLFWVFGTSHSIGRDTKPSPPLKAYAEHRQEKEVFRYPGQKPFKIENQRLELDMEQVTTAAGGKVAPQWPAFIESRAEHFALAEVFLECIQRSHRECIALILSRERQSMENSVQVRHFWERLSLMPEVVKGTPLCVTGSITERRWSLQVFVWSLSRDPH